MDWVYAFFVAQVSDILASMELIDIQPKISGLNWPMILNFKETPDEIPC